MKFVDVTNDIAFRKIFGNENKKISLISFLNAVIILPDNVKITDVTILNPYQLPKLSGGKITIVDVKATDQNKNTFIVEMQIPELDQFDKRILYYTSQSYVDQIISGDDYHKLNPAYFIGILEFKISKNPNYLNRHRVLDVETGENIIRDMEFNFIELPKFNLELSELKTNIEQWVYFLKNAKNLEVIPANIDEGLKEAYTEADKHNWTKEELNEYNKILIKKRDDIGKLEFAVKKAVEKAVKIAEKKGAKKIAKKLKENGVNIKIIIKSTGLSKEEIEKL